MGIERGQPIPIVPSATEIPFLILPEAGSIFLDRVQRLQSLATGHAMGDYLRFVAEIASAQHQAITGGPSMHGAPLDSGLSPFDVDHWPRDPAWHQTLQQIVRTVAAKAPGPLAAYLDGTVSAATAQDFEQWADGYLAGDPGRCDLRLQPLVASALQVYWVAMAQHLHPSALKQHPATTPVHLCPVCGSMPVGSIVRSGAANQGLRYLTCSLCACQWNMARIRCVSCGDSQHVFYYGLDGSDGAIQAETCDACQTYTKIVHMEKNPAVDPVADDLASMSLDILVGETGCHRYGYNPFLTNGV